MAKYTPTVTQAVFGLQFGEFEVPEFAEALFFSVWREISRVYWNKNQKQFDERGCDDPGIEGIVVRPYCWDEDSPEAELPNFEALGVRIFWYKYPGRGMSTDRELGLEEWADWFNRLLVLIRGNDTALY